MVNSLDPPAARSLGPSGSRALAARHGRPIVQVRTGLASLPATAGDHSSGRLKFRFAERVFINSPTRPSSVTVDGAPHPYAYDDRAKLLKAERSGTDGAAAVEY